MIGAFARKLGAKDRVPSVDEIEAAGAPPEGFVEKIPHEGGDVYVSPVLETLRNVLRQRAKRADESPTPRVEAAPTLSPVSENR